MTLDAVEFLHRFFLHVLPKGFVRIRTPTACSPTASATSCCRSHTSCSPSKAANNFPCHPLARMRTLALSPLRQKSYMRVVQRFTAAQLYLAAFDSS